MSSNEIKTGDYGEFQQVDQAHDPQFLFRFLDAASAERDVQAYRQTMLEMLQIQAGQSLLDAGCGLGDATLAMAQRVGSAGRVVGVDSSQVMIDEARRRLAETNLAAEFEVGDIYQLHFADNTFDASRTERVLVHLEQPEQALKELSRVTKPGGFVMVFDVDFDAVIVDHPDLALTRKHLNLLHNTVQRGHIGRELPRLFKAVGLEEVELKLIPLRVQYRFFERLVRPSSAAGQKQGLLTETEVEGWFDDLAQADQKDLFLGVFVGSIVRGRKPQ